MDFNEIEELVHLYVDGAFNRRELVKRVAKITGGTAAAMAAIAAAGVPAEAQSVVCADLRVPEDAPDLENVIAEFPGEAGKMYGYLSIPRKEYAGQLPAVLVIHENRGLNDHIKDVTRRVARMGYVALGIDLLSRQGGTDRFPDPAQATQAFNRETAEQSVADMQAGIAYLRTLGIVKANRVGAIGFCAGGTNSWRIAVGQPDLTAAAVYYGMPPATGDEFERVGAAMLLVYAEQDRNFTGRAATAITELVNRRKTFSAHIYEGVGHAFNNDTGAAFNREAACDAWGKTTEFFARHLRRPD